ncbi:N-acetyl sugar amidotransferase [Candidatus Methylopumilus planktonicus]|uniref:N-acetyl sugar amidotransferase n=1 Tax=Candidatus Methylopumilus planktonicus TaxID=1581557 RepID=UPI003D18D64F
MIKFCKRCLYSTSHPLGLILDSEGICSGCRIHEEKDKLDWPGRWKMLENLVKPYRSKNAKNYDCIIPVTGSQDSYYITYLAKIKLGLNPLLVTYNKFFNTSLGIHNLANLRIRFDCDILFQNINPISVKNITRTTLRKFGSIYWPILAGHTAFPVQTAVRFKIPLILWGAHQGLEQVGMFSHEHEVEMTRRYRKDHDLMGFEADDLLSNFDSLKEKDIWQYRYPDDSDIYKIGVRGIYLGNYVKWDPKPQHEKMIQEYGYRTKSFLRTFDCYDFVDCFNYMNLHDLLKLYKHGYSKVTDHACREIRHGRITRQQALALVRKHELVSIKNLNLFSEWLDISERSLQFVIDQHRNKSFWEKSSLNKWKFNGWSTYHNDAISTNTNQSLVFISNSEQKFLSDNMYITFGKGHA